MSFSCKFYIVLMKKYHHVTHIDISKWKLANVLFFLILVNKQIVNKIKNLDQSVCYSCKQISRKSRSKWQQRNDNNNFNCNNNKTPLRTQFVAAAMQNGMRGVWLVLWGRLHDRELVI